VLGILIVGGGSALTASKSELSTEQLNGTGKGTKNTNERNYFFGLFIYLLE
jgi:hypothetical protein